jgi:hypothetical protein
MADLDLVRVRLRSVRLSLESDDYVGKVLEVRADVAAAWIADGFADPVVDASSPAPPSNEPAAVPGRRRRGSAR